MKKLVLIFAFGVFTAAGVQALPVNESPAFVQTVQDKVEISPEDLPQAVKDTIGESEETKELTISKAYQITDDEGKVIYKVKFGTEEEGITKKYDAEGNEIVEE
ncbi:hypothetical protein QWY93_03110 [Echinicola jeungdonensis]|uniref:PepSY domain-containing protein n=1 Tax=Echinicola jeungdonensis TaxID=709343 RepID=A0ABV5J0X8_9BACT|nr:hypothetical protein [Echinicola jeungdonensis]MDN3668317.1 hypothetical protein [Echinicola jeungdonensis]